MIDEIESLASGECRWIGRHDVHVYCRAPLVETLMPWGRMGWTRGPATYRVSGHDEWVAAPRAAKLVEEILKAG